MKKRSIPTNARPVPPSEDLSIRFVNTVAWRLRETKEERLGSPAVLLEWLGQNQILPPRELSSVRQAWRMQPAAAAKVHDAALKLREAVYQLFLSRIKRRRPPTAALDFFNDFLRGPASGPRIDWEAGELIWRTSSLTAHPLDLLRPIALSAAELMTGHRTHKLRQCEDDRGCGWLFVDESRLQNRRWCSMGDCGNLAKARRYRERARRTARLRNGR